MHPEYKLHSNIVGLSPKLTTQKEQLLEKEFILEEVLKKQLRQNVRARARYGGRTLDKAEEEKMIKNALNMQMNAILQQKFIMEKDDQYTSDWTLDRGVLTGNGEDQTKYLRMLLSR